MSFNSTTPSMASTAPSLSSSDSAILEVLVPGYAFISRFMLNYLHVDPAIYLQQLVLLAVMGAALRYSASYVTSFVKEYFVSTAEIRLDDEIFHYFMYWMSRQPHMRRTNRFVAGVKSNGYWTDSDDDDDDKDNDGEWDEPGSTQGADFDEYWAKVIKRDKYKPLRFTPSQGRHIFWYKNRPLMLERHRENTLNRYVLVNEQLYLSCIGRDASILRDVLDEAQQAYIQRDGLRTIIYRGHRYYPHGSWDWIRCMARPPRPLSTVVLDSDQKQGFIDDIKEYLHPRTRRWYSNRGIPYRRGYLLHGPPGTGKTSLCFAAAGLLGLKLYLLNLNSKSLDEDSLNSLFSDLPRRCMVLLEDIDTAGITQSREKTATSGTKPENEAGGVADPDIVKVDQAAPAGAIAPVAAAEEPVKADGVTLSGLLNVIDGVAASEGRILVMTSNHPEKLDAALLRPGRVDMSIGFEFANQETIEELFNSIYAIKEGDNPRTAASRRIGNGNVKQAKGSSGRPSSSSSSSSFSDIGSLKKSKSQELLEQAEKENQEKQDLLRIRISALTQEFSSIVPAGEFTAAEIQGYLLNHKTTPEQAVEGAERWVEELREKRLRAKEKAA